MHKLYHKGFSLYKISPSTIPFVVVFNPQSGGNAARATLYRSISNSTSVNNTDTSLTGAQSVTLSIDPTPVSSRTVFSATEAEILWNATGTSVLIFSQCDVDASNTSYYGSTNLHLLTVDGTIAVAVPQSKEGPIHDVKWAPDGSKFIVSAGTMPCHCTLFNPKAEPLFEFGTAHRNTISWSPHSRFVVLAGFGNLAGDMDFYDSVRLKKLGSNSAHCTVSCSWSPCSRYFLTATLAPRMNVDNGVKVFTHRGDGPIADHRQAVLYEAFWQPMPLRLFNDRVASPKRQPEAGAAGGAASVTAAVKPVAAYRCAPVCVRMYTRECVTVYGDELKYRWKRKNCSPIALLHTRCPPILYLYPNMASTYPINTPNPALFITL